MRAADVPANTRRGGDLRSLLTPVTVGSAFGFGGIARLGPGEKVAEHYHPYSEEYLVVASGRIAVDLNGRAVAMEAEQAMLIPRNVRHRVRNTGDRDALVVFHLCPLAPRPELGHVDTEDAEGRPLPAAVTP
nr:cupin domain-containing protein [Thermomonospora umbrina]